MDHFETNKNESGQELENVEATLTNNLKAEIGGPCCNFNIPDHNVRLKQG
jgi:hypothetical protein